MLSYATKPGVAVRARGRGRGRGRGVRRTAVRGMGGRAEDGRADPTVACGGRWLRAWVFGGWRLGRPAAVILVGIHVCPAGLLLGRLYQHLWRAVIRLVREGRGGTSSGRGAASGTKAMAVGVGVVVGAAVVNKQASRHRGGSTEVALVKN